MEAQLRGVLGMAVAVGLLVGMPCTAPGTPAPTTEPAKPTATAPAAKPAPTAPPAVKPAETAAAKPAVSADWKAEWDKTVAAAKKEGKVVVAGAPGETPRKAAMAFQKAYPDIQLEFSGVQGSEFAPKLLAERDGGQYLWDVHIGGTTTMMTMLKPKGVIDPLRPALMLPEVLDASKWLGGFEDVWMDKDHQLIIAFEGRLRSIAFANRQLAPESELSSIDQLLEPKFNGKMISMDPRIAGPAGPPSGYLLKVKGEDWLRRLFAQNPTVTKDARTAVESVVRGANPVGLYLDPVQLEFFVMQGAASHVKPVEIQGAAGAQLTAGFGNVSLVSKAPHPNAAKVFVNWLLSQEGQKAYVEATNLNSRRLDVTGPAATAPNPTVKYLDIMKEEYLPDLQRAQEIAKEMLK